MSSGRREEGREEGREEEGKRIVSNMIATDLFSLDEISKVTGISAEIVNTIASEAPLQKDTHKTK